jgi:Flp pilus assembly protein TadG
MNRKKRQRGAAALEFGLSFILFISVVYAIMEFGRVVASYDILAGATREGSRYATVHGSSSATPASSSDIQDLVRRWAIGLDSSSLTVSTTWTPTKGPGSQVKVQASYAMSPFTGWIFANDITLKSSSAMIISQ